MIYHADCVLVGAEFAELSPGRVQVKRGRIVAVGSDASTSGERVVDFRARAGRTIIIPGLIDGHCHLELSNLAGRIRYRGSLVRWLGELMVKRPKRWVTQARAVRRGVAASLANGTTTVADISANSRSWQATTDLPIRTVCFAEVVGIGKKRHVSTRHIAGKIDAMPDESPTFFRGVSPHAPYSTDAGVYRQAIALADERGLRLTTHLAEDPAEIEFLRTATGSWPRVLKTFGLWDDSITAYGAGPVEFARDMGLLDRPTILAHVNYVDSDDIAHLAAGRASVVYCPLAHRYFHHGPHRYREMIDVGINVAVGNDSLACSADLSVLAQMRAVFDAGGLSPQTVLAMGTRWAARALHFEDTIGTIEPGKSADLAVLVVHDHDTLRPIVESVLTCPTDVLATVVAGDVAHSTGENR